MPTRSVPFPADEEQRLATLGEYALLDAPSDALFEALAALAAHACDTPIGLIVLVDRERQWFLANAGFINVRESTRDVAFCAYTILHDGMTEIPDAANDPRFARNPFVLGEPFVRFYAGVPLVVSNGQTLGTLCVLDRRVRQLNGSQRDALSALARVVVEQFEQRRFARRLVAGVAGDKGADTEGDVAEAIVRGTALELVNEQLTTLTEVARNVFASLDPRALVESLVRGVGQLTAGGTAQVLVRDARGAFHPTRDLLQAASSVGVDDAFLLAAAAHDGALLAADGKRAGVPVVARAGIVSHLIDIRAGGRTFAATDAFAFGLLGQYLAVAVRNAELYGELASRRAAVIELNQVKNDLIAMLAHDFKGPLTTIVGLADVLAEDERFDAETLNLLGMINSSAMRLASLASDTLALSRLEQNELSLRFDTVDLVALLRDIVRVFSVTRGIDLRAGAEVLAVRADAARLRQLFENLIGNAIKYSPRGGTVDVTIRDKGNGVEIAIRDRGIGIPAADISKLFGRFARGSNARELGIGGTGFGLYLSRTIIEMHGGHISIESKEGVGSTFSVFVPAVPAPQRTLDRRILLLDSEDDGRSFIAHTLRDDGYVVTAVADESALLAALAEARYDAAIVDVDRLRGDAGELYERIDHRATLVRLVSTAESEGTVWNAALRKPFLIKDLQVVLEAAVAERRRLPRDA